MAMNGGEKVWVNFLIEAEKKEGLERLAAAKQRTLSAQLRWLIDQALVEDGQVPTQEASGKTRDDE